MPTDWLRHIKSRIRLPLEVLKCRISGVYKPLVVLLYATDRCNLACRYCVNNWSHRQIKDFTTQELIRIIDECKDLGTCHFTIHGGEILLRDDTAKLIDYMKSNNFYVNLVTNGLLLPEKINEVIKVDSLCISLDGRQEGNDFNRGEGSYQAIMKAIILAKEKKMKFNVHATLTKKSVNDIEYLCKQAKELGYYQQFSLFLKPLKPSQQELALTDDEYRQALLKIIALKKKGYPVFTSYRVLNNALNWSFAYSRSRLNKDEIPPKSNIIRCFYGKLKLVIDADGCAYPCSSLNDTFEALNVKEVGVKKAYEHVLKNNTCEACYYLTQNDWNLFLSANPLQYWDQVFIQLKEIFNII